MVIRLGPASVRFTARADGDLGSVDDRGPSGPRAETLARRRAVLDLPWSWFRQVHGAGVVTVDTPGAGSGQEVDAAVSAQVGVALAIFTADCAPLALASPEGVVGAVHAGWRGLAAGVVSETVRTMQQLGATSIEAALGPCIRPECYEFSPVDLDEVAAALGDHVRAATSWGGPALDLPGAVRAATEDAGARVVFDAAACTACSTDGAGAPQWFSHRARRDVARQAMVVWREP